MKRRSLSKKKRFDVFKRDSFTCQYCGATPPGAVLEVDHIHPVANEGTDSIDNLITACFDCNRGKSSNLLSEIPQSLKNRAEEIREREEQIKGYNAILAAKAIRLSNEAWDIADAIEGSEWVDSFGDADLQSIRMFLERLPFAVVMEAAVVSHSKWLSSSDRRFRYFCGICWSKIRELSHGTR